MSVEDYLHSTDKPYYEYRDGVISQKALGIKGHSIIHRDGRQAAQALTHLFMHNG